MHAFPRYRLPFALVLAFSLGLLSTNAGQADEYPRPEDVSKSLRELAASHPDSLRVENLATTRGGREVLALTLAFPGALLAEQRQAILVTAGLDAALLHTTEVAVGMLSELLRRQGEPTVRDLLTSRTIYWIPQANPDGAAHFFDRPRLESPLNSRADDDDHDGRVDEDGPEDLDQDGEILTLRVPDPSGPWVVDAVDDRILRPAAADETTRARFRLVEEGIDNDGDGLVNEDPPGGVNLARNFPHEFAERASGSGPYPACEAETRAMLDFALTHPNIQLALHLGVHDNLGAPPPARDGRPALRGEHKFFKPDAELFAAFAERFKKTTAMRSKAVDASPRGAWHETLYFELGVPCFAVCLHGADPPPAADGNAERSPERRWLDWNDNTQGGAAFVRWRPFDHPQLGRVHIGGWRPFARANPPRAEAAKWAPPQATFLLELATALPQIVVDAVRAKDLGEGLFEVTARVLNRGELPTGCAQGVFTGRRSPLNIELVGESLRCLSGDARKTQGVLAAGRFEELSWLVLSSKGAQVKIEVRLRGQALASKTFTLEGGGSL